MPLFGSLYNFAHWLARNETDAEDLVQETYLKALRSFASFQPGTNFRAWMFQILRNTFLSSRSKLEWRMTVAMDPEEDGAELAVENENPETILVKSLDSQLVQSALEGLPVHHREILLLCEVEEMSYQEIAEVLSIPIGTVMSRLARARKAIRQSLSSTADAHLRRRVPNSLETHTKDTGAVEVAQTSGGDELRARRSGLRCRKRQTAA